MNKGKAAVISALKSASIAQQQFHLLLRLYRDAAIMRALFRAIHVLGKFFEQ